MKTIQIKELSKNLFESLLDEGKNYEDFVKKINKIVNNFLNAYNAYNSEHANVGQETTVEIIPHPFDNKYNYQVVECLFNPTLKNVPEDLMDQFKSSLIYASGARSLEDNQILYNVPYNDLVNSAYKSNNMFLSNNDAQYVKNLIFLRHANASDTLDKGNVIPDDSKEGKWSALQDRWSDENGNPTYEGFKKFMTVQVCLNFLQNYEQNIKDIFNNDEELANKLLSDPSIMNNLIWNPQELQANLHDISFNRKLKNHNIANKVWKLLNIGKAYNIEEFESFSKEDWNELDALFQTADINNNPDKKINTLNNLAKKYLNPATYSTDDQQLVYFYNTTIANQLKEAYTKYLYDHLNNMKKADYYVIMAQMTKDRKELARPYYINKQGSLTTNIDEALHFANRNNKNNITSEIFKNTIAAYPEYLWRVEKQSDSDNIELAADNLNNIDRINYLDQMKKDLNNTDNYKQFSNKYFNNIDGTNTNNNSIENPISDMEALDWINNQFK